MKSKILPTTYSTVLTVDPSEQNKSINCSILESSDAAVTKLLFCDNTLSNSYNTFILNSSIEYIISTQRFEYNNRKALPTFY